MKHSITLLITLLPLMLLSLSIHVDIPLESPTHEINSEKLQKLGYGSTVSPGSLQLPVKNINVLIPPESTILSYSISLSAPQTISGKAPAINPAFSDGEKLLSKDVSNHTPAPYSFLGMHKWGDLRYAAISVLPAYWDGTNWQWSGSCTINLETSASKATGIIPSSFSDAAFFANSSDLPAWYSEEHSRNYDVLVIGTPALYAAFASWVSFRQSQGLVVVFTDIDVALSQGMETTDAEKLRSYLREQYQANNFSYLLLLGDYDTVPVAYLSPEPDGFDTVPSDFFYGDLSSNWDSDNDGRLGEYSTGAMNQDYEVDFTPEVYVGRISTNNASQVSAIATRIVSFEQSTAPWKAKNLLPAAMLNYHDEPELNMLATDGADYMEFVKATVLAEHSNISLYEQEGVVPSYVCDFPLNDLNFRNLLDTQSWGLINWSAHGSSASSSRKLWLEDTNENGLPENNEMTWLGLVSRNSFDNLGNSDGSVIFAASCYNGMIDSNQASLAEYALAKKAVGVLAATRTGWYKIGWTNPGWGGLSSYNYHFLENYRQAGMSLGASHAYANLLHTRYYLFGDPIDDGGVIWPELQNVYTYLLFGDPLIGYTPTAPVPEGDILVWEPNGQQGLSVVNALGEASNMNVIYTDKLIENYDYLSQFKAIFCLFGFGEDSYYLSDTSFQHNLLNAYLETGGSIYLESDMPWYPQSSALWSKFGTHTPVNGFVFISNVLHPTSNNVWQYGNPSHPTQILIPYVDSASTLFSTQNIDPPDASIGIWNSNGNYRTIASSFSLSQIIHGTTDLSDILAIICDTLAVNNGNPSTITEETNIPMVNSLISYPNPSNNHTNFSFNLDKASPVNLDIYNLKGQKVRNISSAALNKGMREIVWDGRDTAGKQCASGLYLYRLTAGNAQLSGKQIILHK
ncbi:MAG: C25 family cysteine peptidase [Candidatus Cloacimonetes bacterium]|nr:C25 family cysteine peptidase [Candidatus Cloacimonadota bacterium]